MEWQHEDLGPDSEPDDGWNGEHLGTLETGLINLNANIGISDYWNVDITSTFGERWMNWDVDSTSIHHRDESTSDKMGNYMGTTIIARYLLFNENIGAGKRIFLGMGLLIPSENTFTENPLLLSNNLERHTHFTLSDGNYKGILELQYFNRTKKLFFFGSTFRMDKSLKKSRAGYRVGDSFNYTGFAFLHHHKTLEYISPFFMLSASHKTKDHWESTGYAENSDGGSLKVGMGINREIGLFNINFTMNKTVKTWLTPAGDDAKQVDSKMESTHYAISVRKVINY